MAQELLVGQGLLVIDLHDRTQTHHIWKDSSGRVISPTLTTRHTKDRHPCHWLDSNPKSQQAGGRHILLIASRNKTGGRGLDSSGFGQGRTYGCCEHGDEHSGSVKRGEFLH